MRLAGRHAHQQRITRATPCPTGSLNVVSLLWRNRTLQHAGQVANIDTHLKSGCRGEHINAPGAITVGFKVALYRLARFARQQAGMLMRYHPPNVRIQIELAIKITGYI